MKNMTKLDLTVVIPTFNRSHELVRALNSLVAQTDSDFEVVVCDDGSTENIAEAIQGFHSQLRLKLLRIENSGGPARPRNVATQAATTAWISYLDSDDWWFPERVAVVKKSLNEDVDIVYHPLRIERDDFDKKAKPSHGSQVGAPLLNKDPILHMIRVGNPFPTSGTTVKRELMLTIGGFDESRDLASVEDFDAWLRIAAKGVRIKYIPQALGAYWVGTDHISKFNKRQFECQRQLFHRQLQILPEVYHLQADSNFKYLLGSYALDLGIPDAVSYFREINFLIAPKKWVKSRLKMLSRILTRD